MFRINYFKTWKAFWLIYMGSPRHGCNMFIVKLKNIITFNYKKCHYFISTEAFLITQCNCTSIGSCSTKTRTNGSAAARKIMAMQPAIARQKASTRHLYALKCSVSSTWCQDCDLDPITSDVSLVLSFLQEMLDKQHSSSTVKVYAAAIAAFHAPIAGRSVGSDSVVVQFL